MNGGGVSAIVWQEITYTDEERGTVQVYLLSRRGTRDWGEPAPVGEPYGFTGKESPVFSACVTNRGHIFIAVRNERESIDVYRSTDGGGNFTRTGSVFSFSTTVAPRIFAKADGGLVLFVIRETVTVELGDTLEIYYTISENGEEWSEVQALARGAEQKLNFLPYHTSHKGREYVAFQVLETGERPSYQVYLTISDDGGRTFGNPVLLTGFPELLEGEERDPQFFDNQRPFLLGLNGNLAMVWERRFGGTNPQIYYMEIGPGGRTIGVPEAVTTGMRSCHFPRMFSAGGRTYVTWFDDRVGNEHIILAYRDGVFWRDRDITGINGISTFARTIIEDGKPFIIWENLLGSTSRLVYLAPDETVPAPVPAAQNFIPGGRFRQDRYAVRWSLPEDSSGIAGFAYSWDRNPEGSPPKRIMTLQRDREAAYTADEDGMWYFHVSANDYAGNWSKPGRLSFYRDTTPPERVTIAEPEYDEQGFLVSNTFTMEWEPSKDEDYIAGYSYNLQYLGGYNLEELNITPPPPRVMTTDTEVYFRNRDNGLWAFSARAVDTVGNAGEPVSIVFNMNKYIPETYITAVDAERDALGRVTLTIFGRGFSVGGLVSKVILDRDGEGPFDYEYQLDFDAYDVVNDRQIDGPVIEDVDEGRYRIGLLHPERGLYFTRPYIDLESTGAVKFGDFTALPERQWQPVRETLVTLSANSFLLYLLLLLLAAGLIFSTLKISAVVKEGKKLEMEVRALITQRGLTEQQKKERLQEMKKRGMGLRIKFTLFITLLIIVVVLVVASALAYISINTQRDNLAMGLRKQTEVLLESLTSSARSYLPAKNTLELGLIPEQRFAMEDSLFATITGGGENDPDRYNYVWASDDENIRRKIDTDTLSIGVSRIEDEVTPKARELQERLNREARETLGDITEQLDILGEQARAIALSEEAGAEEQLSRYQREIRDLEQQVNITLKELGDVIGSVPEFSIENLEEAEREYVFYRPVVYRTVGQDTYYKGLVRLAVSTDRIVAEINESVRGLVLIIAIIAVISIGIGVVGAVIFASILIIPIKRLVAGVEVIRDTEDKSKLQDHKIAIKSKDEISTLADTVNQMTTGLVKAAAANKELLIGKDVQKMFIPLEEKPDGGKRSTGKETNERISFFGYYVGAKGVSGDYFDYRKLDDKHYAIIKCDVAGKGVPASLIMVEVATIFLSYFKNWNISKNGINLSELVYSMNDLLEERGFKGRFAALIVIIVNTETGESYMCNAGDNIVHIYDQASSRMYQKLLPEAPAAGVFPSMIVEMKDGFPQIAHQLDRGDTMFMFTDGIEEGQRKFRNETFQLITCNEPGIGENEMHGNHAKGSEFEELGIPRIDDIITAVYRRGNYSLKKYHNPIPDEKLTFDFSSCEETVENAVLAMVAVEKIFRIYPDPSATAEDKVVVDKVIDTFLQEHFEQYQLYFSHPRESDDEDQVVFTHLKEDEQYDDLTVLGVRKL